MKKTHIALSLAAFVAFASTAGAASLVVGFQATIASEFHPDSTGEGNHYHVSVNPNNPGYAAYVATVPGTNNPDTPFQRAFTAPVQGWSFVGGGTNNVLTIAQESGGLISYTTTSTSFDSFGQNQRLLWGTSDPGSDLLNPATPHDFQGPGYRNGFVNAEATIDVSELASGTVYVFYGDFRGTPTLSAVMRDTSGNAPDHIITNAHLNGDFANRAEYYVAELDFVTDGIYDQIVYTWNATGDNGTNGRFGGTVLTGFLVPEPSKSVLIALGGLGLLLRRRRS